MVKPKKSKKKLDECCELCGEGSCNIHKHKPLRIYFCPKCKSKDVGFIFSFRNIFGIIPKMRCKKCGFESVVFPQVIISKEQLNKLEKKK